MFFTRRLWGRIDEVDSRVRESFEKVKKDVGSLGQWVRYLQRQNQEQRKALHQVHALQRHAVTREQMDAAIKRMSAQVVASQSFSRQEYEDRLGRIEARLVAVEGMLKERIAQGPVEPKVRTSHLREKIASTVGRQSKEYIKRAILSVCGKYESITATSLREIVVDEQKLCSRSSFYRLLDELAAEGNMDVSSSGKERILSANRKLFKH